MVSVLADFPALGEAAPLAARAAALGPRLAELRAAAQAKSAAFLAHRTALTARVRLFPLALHGLMAINGRLFADLGELVEALPAEIPARLNEDELEQYEQVLSVVHMMCDELERGMQDELELS